LKNAYKFPLYFLPPDRNGASDSFNDDNFEGYSAQAAAWFASTYRNGYAQWYYRHAPLSHTDKVAEFLWYDSSIPSVSPGSLPTSAIFPDIGWAALRSGWDTDDTLIGFRSGIANAGHSRPEQNSFFLDALGERLIIEPGMPTGGYTDSDYEGYYRTTLSQNTILINGDPQSQEKILLNAGSQPAGEITDSVNSNFYDAVTGSAARVYKGKLATFDRHLVFIKSSGYAVVFDNLISSVGPVEFDSLLHAEGTNSISVSGDTVRITQNAATLHAKVLTPSGFQYEIRTTPDRPNSYILFHPAVNSISAQFLLTLYPTATGGSPPPITRIQNGSVTGVKVVQGDVTDLVLFNPSGSGISAEGVTSDANQVYVRLENGAVTAFAIHQGKTLAYHGIHLFTAANPATAACSDADASGLMPCESA
jgi:hypothetical protein